MEKESVFNVENHDSAPKLSEGDEIYYKTPDKRPFAMKVHTYEIDLKGKKVRRWSLIGKNIVDPHPKETLQKPVFEKGSEPIVILDTTMPDKKHPKENLIDVQKQIAQEYPFFESDGKSDIKENHLRGKYPHYPFKKSKSLTNPQHKKEVNYEVVQGNIIDPELAKNVGVEPDEKVYYLKAQRDFTVENGDLAYNVKKGDVSGPIVLSHDKIRRAKQIKALREEANQRVGQSRKLHIKGRKQNFWMSRDSVIKGNVSVPTSGMIIDSVLIGQEDPKQSPKSGIAFEGSNVINSRVLAGKNASIIGFNQNDIIKSQVLAHPNATIMVTDSNLNNSALINTQKGKMQQVASSSVMRAYVRDQSNIQDSLIDRPQSAGFTEIKNSTVQNSNLTTGAYGKVEDKNITGIQKHTGNLHMDF